MAIKAIIFDVGGVLIHYDNTRNYFMSEMARIAKKTKVTKEKIAYVYNVLFPMFEEGKMSKKEYDRRMAKLFGISEKEVDWYGNFVKYAKLNKPIFRLIERLRSKGIAIAYFSNVDKSRYMHMKLLLKPYAKLFDYSFASCYMGTRKPYKIAFEKVLRKMRVKPEEALFVDNEPKNVEGAEKAGIKSILFKNNKDLEKRIKGYVWQKA